MHEITFFQTLYSYKSIYITFYEFPLPQVYICQKLYQVVYQVLLHSEPRPH